MLSTQANSQASVAFPTTTPMKTWTGVQGGKYHLVQTMDQFQKFIGLLKAQTVVAVDTETSGLDWVRDHVCGLVFGWGIEHNYYLPIAHQTEEPQLDIEQIRASLQEVLGNLKVQKIFWNEVFDRHFLRKCGLEVKGACFDGVCILHLLDEEGEKGLKEVACRYIDRRCDAWEKAVDKWRDTEAKRRRSAFGDLLKNTLSDKRMEIEQEFNAKHPMAGLVLTKAQITAKLKDIVKKRLANHPWANVKKAAITYDMVPLDILAPYAAADVHYTLMLWKQFFKPVMEHHQLRELLKNEIQLSDLIFNVEEHGVKVDIPYLRSLEPVFLKAMDEAKEEIYAAVGYRFNIESNEELIVALRKAGCHLTKLTKKGKENQQAGKEVSAKEFSVDNEVLEFLASTYDFAAKIQAFREKRKLLTTYCHRIIELVDERHYLHSRFNANVATGRMSSSEPNVQNIPGKNLDIRRAFTVPEEIGEEGFGSDDFVFVFADYSQVELRLTAHWSQDPTLLAAYSPLAPGWIGKEQDVHTITLADVVLMRPLEEVQAILKDKNHPEAAEFKWRRNIAKRVNFGIIYGAGPGAIQRQVSSPKRPVGKDECAKYIGKYFEKYQGVKQWIDVSHLQMRRSGYLQNSFGRYRRLHDSKSKEKWKRERAERQGVNFLIQGDAADLFKHAAVRVFNFLKQQKAKTRIVNFVHDEIQFYWHKSEFHLMAPVKKLMEDFPQFRVPIVVEFAWSKRDWASKQEIKH